MQKYNFVEIEKNKQKFWKENHFFSTHNTNKNSFSILMPPPNITGKLHLGHAGDIIIQDCLSRFYKLLNYDVLYIPGLDHAGIATQIKVLAMIQKKFNLTLKEIPKKFLLTSINDWKKEKSELIIKQWDQLGASVDLNYLLFTLDKKIEQQIKDIFVFLYQKKLIYQAQRIIFWDVKLKTALSNIEVTYQNQTSNLYYVKYYLQNSDQFLVVATTRPETIFVDQALFIHPQDQRYLQYLNCQVINPLTKEIIPVLKDDYVDITFGSGVLKCTPAHDQNDFLLAKKHHLKVKSCLDLNGKINSNGFQYQGLDRFQAQKKIIADLKAQNLLIKIEKIINKIPFNPRSQTILEPLVSKQWFLALKKICNQKFVNNLKKQMFADDKKKSLIKPYKFSKLFFNWIRDIDDWCISRQIAWGHPLPIYTNKKTKEILVSNKEPDLNKYQPSLDVLDTWFSSALWPLLTLNYDLKTNKINNHYFPINCLVTGYDIIFFWVAKMIILTLVLKKQLPFQRILIHGIIRDKNNIKMSKSKNNGVDFLMLIKKYGIDALRLYLILHFSSGHDLKFNQILIKQASINLNKIYQSFNYLGQNINLNDNLLSKFNFAEIKNEFNLWIINQFQIASNNYIKNFLKSNLKNATFDLLIFFKNVFCAQYLEISKILIHNTENKLKKETLTVLFFLFKNFLILFQPIIPFLSEHLYQKLNLKKSILEEKITSFHFQIKNFVDIDYLWILITKIRKFKHTYGIKQFLQINIKTTTKLNFDLNWYNQFLQKLTNCSIKQIIINQKPSKYFSVNFINKVRIEFLTTKIQDLAIKNQIKKEFMFVNNEIKRCQTLLKNKHFLKNASVEKIKLEENKLEIFKKNLVELNYNIINLKI